MAPSTGAQIIARSLRDLGVTVIFGIVGIPVVDIAEEAINLGIKFIGFRNEQAAGYAASAYGYLTGRPGVCLVVGGPGVLHAIPGLGNSSINAFPLLLLGGSAETHLISKGAFQELDAISLLTPHTKLALRPSSLETIPEALQSAYRHAWYGRPGPSFIDLPADIIQGHLPSTNDRPTITTLIPPPPKPSADEPILFKAAQLLKTARAPLIVIGKGTAYARASKAIHTLISRCKIPFLPTPMGKGVLPDSHPLNTASARSTALKEADVVLLLGARLNWILHFGSPPKWSPNAKFIQVDIAAEELGKNNDDGISIQADISTFIPQLLSHLQNWSYLPSASPYTSHLLAAKEKNLAAAAQKAADKSLPMTHSAALAAIERTLSSLSPPDEGNIVYVSEGANTMDLARSIFPVSHPRLRLDAGTHATMGVGMGYAIAAHIAYNGLGSQPGEATVGVGGVDADKSGRKKVVCLEGDSAFGFSGMEVETMARYNMDILIFVINNGGVYHGDADNECEWTELQRSTLGGTPSSSSSEAAKKNQGLRSTSLGFQTRYQDLATMVGGLALEARTPQQVEDATREGYKSESVCVVNVIVGKGDGGKLEFRWQASSAKTPTASVEKGREKGKGGRGAKL
ncbi:MAG: hypothetical protein LQ352_008353 [Teloschistes flavicans]|nr:MAG: hypothetical protein LQ352_008353 [Teloschistes flavicans]